jgi:tetratricopeptide (TPR) repeat protein
MKYWNDALLIWKNLDEKRSVSRLYRKMANVLWEKMGDTEKAKEHYADALKIMEAEPESVELASLYEDMAHMYYRTGDITKALSWAEKALELAKKLNAHEVEASSYVSLGTILTFTGEREKSFGYLEKAMKIALNDGYMETALRAQINLAGALPTEESERIFGCYEKAYELAKKVGDISNQSWSGLILAWNYVGIGNMNKALLLAEESVALDRKVGYMIHLPASIDGLGIICQIFGEWDKSEQYHKEASSLSHEIKDWQIVANNQWAYGWLCLEKGEHAKAREHFEKACEVSEKAGGKDSQMVYSTWLVLTYIELGENEKANHLIDNMRAYALERKNRWITAYADAVKATLFRAQNKWEDSLALFERNIQEFDSYDARRWDVYLFAKFALCEYARTYLERDQEGDRQKANDLFNQALEIFQKDGREEGH